MAMDTPPNKTLPTVADDLFRTILDDGLIGPPTFEGVCTSIARGRADKAADVEHSSRAVQMIIELGLYTEKLEPLILAQSQEFAIKWANTNSKAKRLPAYIQAVMKLFKVEAGRCDAIGLSTGTKRDLITLLEEHVIKGKQEVLTDGQDIAALLDDNSLVELEALYSLLKRCDLTDTLIAPFEAWIKARGTAIVFDEEHEADMVVSLLTLRKQADNIWCVAFHQNKEFSFGIRNAFVDFMNKTKKSAATYNTENSKQGEMIAKYVDFLLRGGAKAIPSALSKPAPQMDEEDDNEVQDGNAIMKDQLDQVLDLFRFLEGKAVFEAFYKKDLARRLLLARSASSDDERSMLARLKAECGYNFTHNLETMFKDIELSKEEMRAHKEGLAEGAHAVDLDVNILCLAAWPTYPDVKVNLPNAVRQALEHFEQGYRDRHKGRGLIWKHSLAHCQMRAVFPKGRKELSVSGFQAVVLVLFNNTELDATLSYERIRSETGLGWFFQFFGHANSTDEGDLKRTLQSLACAKLRPLRKHPHGREIKKTDVFSVNKSFEHPNTRVKINQVQLKETKQENKETHERLQVDRELEIQAAIVRIMKSEKNLSHNILVTKVIEATKKRGAVPMAELKKQIEK
jgi:cullin 4